MNENEYAIGDLVLYKNNQLIAFNKPPNVPVQDDKSQDKSLLALVRVPATTLETIKSEAMETALEQMLGGHPPHRRVVDGHRRHVALVERRGDVHHRHVELLGGALVGPRVQRGKHAIAGPTLEPVQRRHVGFGVHRHRPPRILPGVFDDAPDQLCVSGDFDGECEGNVLEIVSTH